MAFTNPWNDTIPADTQAANQLGLDIRNLKLDIQERLRQFGSGLISARPTPDAAFGDANNGVVFLATDTGKFYAWNGAVWTEVAGAGRTSLIADPNDNAVLNPGGLDVPLNSVDIPANALAVGMAVSITAYGEQVASGGSVAGAKNKLFLGATRLADTGPTVAAQQYDYYFHATGQVTAVGASGKIVIGTRGNAFFGNSSVANDGANSGSMFELAVDTTSTINVSLTATGTGSFQSKGLFVRLIG